MKKIGVIGTGAVGARISSKLIELGYEVMMGSRTKDNAKGLAWVSANGAKASLGTFTETAQFGEVVFLCANGGAILDILRMAGIDNFNGKTVIDITNSLDFSKGMPPSLLICNTNSLGEEVQKLLVGAHVVKTLNTVNNEVMVDAAKAGGDTTMFMSGNDAGAKDQVKEILQQFGWTDILDLGDITAARGTEMLLPLWVRLATVLKTARMNVKVVKA